MYTRISTLPKTSMWFWVNFHDCFPRQLPASSMGKILLWWSLITAKKQRGKQGEFLDKASLRPESHRNLFSAIFGFHLFESVPWNLLFPDLWSKCPWREKIILENKLVWTTYGQIYHYCFKDWAECSYESWKMAFSLKLCLVDILRAPVAFSEISQYFCVWGQITVLSLPLTVEQDMLLIHNLKQMY